MQDKKQKKEEILQAYHFRHATKQFDPDKKIPDDDFRFILETARLSPSSFGLEPWRFVVVQNEELLEKIRLTAWGTYGKLPGASHLVLLLARTKVDMKYDSDYIKDQMKNVKKMSEEVMKKYFGYIEEFQKNDFKLLDHDRFLFDWACKQTYIALGNMMTAAAQIGIDSCPIEGFNRDDMTKLLEEEGLLENGHFGLSVMVAFGYRIKEPAPKTRRSFEDVVKWVK